jgi:transcriptional regulator with XRE-family HTH domain
MGRHPRRKQERLAEKLLRIRLSLGLSQNEMLRHLGIEEALYRTSISNYELGDREPPLYVLLSYARAANVFVDVLIDEELDLPEKIPASTKSEGIRLRKPVRKRLGG